jgi:serine protease inhibitor
MTEESTHVLNPGVVASNVLTARWAGAAGGRGGQLVLSGAAVWPLLAALAAGAEGQARKELGRALGIPAASALAAMRDVLGAIDRGTGVHPALGLWLSKDVHLHSAWSAALPANIRGVLSGRPKRDQAALDAWVYKHTLGILDRLPVQLESNTYLVLVACLAIRTTWDTRFTDGHGVPRSFASGPWKDRLVTGLQAESEDLTRIAVFDTPVGAVTMFDSRGVDSVDVHLVLGPTHAAAGDVLRESIVALTESLPRRSGGELLPGDPAPGVLVADVPCERPRSPWLSVQTVSFEVAAKHDLRRHGELFGLMAASDVSREHFPGITDSPLAVGPARQHARAMFTARGFEAAASTASIMLYGVSRPPSGRHTVRVIQLMFDRPFGFIAIDRPSGLVLMAGWVDEPTPHPDAADYEVVREGNTVAVKSRS